MSRFDCREARRCLEAAMSDSLSERERQALDAHLAFCERCGEEARLWASAIGVARNAAVEPRPAPVWEAAGTPAAPSTARPLRRRAILLVAVLSLVAVGALAAVLPGIWREPEEARAPAPGGGGPEGGDVLELESGVEPIPETTAPVGEVAPIDDPVPTVGPSDERTYGAVGAIEPRLALRVVETDETLPPGIDGLVQRAQRLRGEREYAQACYVYREIIDRFPGSTASANARVALGQIELGAMGRPTEAVGYFDAYLDRAPEGVLAEDARLGRVRAWVALGDRNEILAAGDEFLERHPVGHSVPEVLRIRGDTLRMTGDCTGAVSDYTSVLDGWPDSPHAEWARVGLDTCGQR